MFFISVKYKGKIYQLEVSVTPASWLARSGRQRQPLQAKRPLPLHFCEKDSPLHPERGGETPRRVNPFEEKDLWRKTPSFKVEHQIRRNIKKSIIYTSIDSSSPYLHDGILKKVPSWTNLRVKRCRKSPKIHWSYGSSSTERSEFSKVVI